MLQMEQCGVIKCFIKVT